MSTEDQAAKVLQLAHKMMRDSWAMIDGDQWCALYGANLQDGVAGFGDSPALAMTAFDQAWSEKLARRFQPAKDQT